MAAHITILGLGPGDPALLTREAWQELAGAQEIYARTRRHPTLDGLPAALTVHSFDTLYESHEDFGAVYQAIVARVLALGQRPGGVIYAVPGDPLIGEATTARLLAEAPARGLRVRLIHGLSFVEPCLGLLGVDALAGLFVADALDLAARHHPPFHPDAPALIAQLYSPALASDVKLCLMNQYPDDHPIHLIHAAATSGAALESLPLYQLDRSARIAHLTSLFVPALPAAASFEAFQETIAHLRAPDGCPWDREQTHQSLRGNLLEEAYEALAALDADDPDAMREEFGDLLLQIVLQSQIALEAGEFSLAEVVHDINAKLVRRHPHVFEGLQVDGVAEVLHNWEQLKAREREGDGGRGGGLLSSIPPAMPALELASAYQRRVARVGFDWPDLAGVQHKIQEELAEVASAAPAERAAELGDLLFAVVNYARWLEVNPEIALREAAARFRRRFEWVEAAAGSGSMEAMSPAELDALWQSAKATEAG
ncbi:MAG: nucleoside triphosphate pyrophosphohydrolase [Chloroflexi bacterium]|nr:nucleoside triphosphate pyrophosphohydrolase [Chloroflexota bacterium]